MKIHFEADLPFQQRAIEAVARLLHGAERCTSEFTVLAPGQRGPQTQLLHTQVGVGNRLELRGPDLLENLQKVQLDEGLPQSTQLADRDRNFTVEMETGTGKTYVYLRTIFELHRRYGFSKFIIVVPSVAIRAGVLKSLEMTKEHFLGLYNEAATVTEYDSKQLGAIRSFATTPSLQVMVMTVGAINKKDVNNLYKGPEGNEDEAPIELIRQVRPIVIIDEPQSVDGLSAGESTGKAKGGKGKEAVDRMDPLFTLRYSATHKNSFHPVYKLDAVQAYNEGLVKHIRVASARIESAHNRPYVGLTTVVAKKGQLPHAKVELDVAGAQGAVLRQERTVQAGDDLEQVTRRPVYRGIVVTDLNASRDNMSLTLRLPGAEKMLRPGEVHGSVEVDALHRAMIARTIEEHLKRALLLQPKGIKVLSLFFIDHVERYRKYPPPADKKEKVAGSEKPAPQKGDLALIFEQEMRKLISQDPYKALYPDQDPAQAAARAHNGYFAEDKKTGQSLDSKEGSEGEEVKAAFQLIMKDKERLLSLSEPLQFIFSHSALREGWDNPNVFQICALREFGTESQRRQVIGRGLRICVNQRGERVREPGVNELTVVANEGYETFAARLQAEIEEETGIRFGFVQLDQLSTLVARDEDGSNPRALGAAAAKRLLDWLKAEQYINAQGKAEERLKADLSSGKLALPEDMKPFQEAAVALLKRITSRIQITDADKRGTRRHSNAAVIDSEEFRALWDRVKHRTTYRVDFNPEALVADCTKALREQPAFARARVVFDSAGLGLSEGGVTTHDIKVGEQVRSLDEGRLDLPDILTELQDRTQLTRRSLSRMLIDCGRLYDFEKNPVEFIRQAAELINREKRKAIVDGIRYVRLGEGEVYAQELFKQTEVTEYLKEHLIRSTKSPHDHVVFDSKGVEQAFVKGLESNGDVKVYAKLPDWFKIPTPLGTYNPDWAVLVERGGEQRLYFVVETKGSIYKDDLRSKEAMKIKCGEKHFEAVRVCEPGVQYMVEKSFEEFASKWP